MRNNQQASDLLDEVFECSACERQEFGFSRPGEGRPFYKFPPTIGATGEASLLFVGINPRMSAGNPWLHELILKDRTRFEELSRNRVNGRRYIAKTGGERHYRYHLHLVECVYADNAKFENHAAVTERFLCAKHDSTGLPRDRSPCADRYLNRVVHQVRPRVIFAVERPVEYYFQTLASRRGSRLKVSIAGIDTTVLAVPHPNSRGPRLRPWGEACRAAKEILGIR